MIPAFTWLAAPSGALLFVNARCADYLGLPKDHPLRFGTDTGAAWDSHISFLHPDDHEEMRRVGSDNLRTGGTAEASCRIRDAQGNEKELLQTLDLAPQIIGKLSPRRERLYANRATLAYYGLTLDEWLRGSFRSEVDPEDHDRFTAAADAALVSGSEFELELRLRNRDGHSCWHLARYNQLRDDNGQVVRWYVACTDVDDRKRAEERLRQENVALREEVDKASMFEEIVGGSPALTAVLSQVSKVASSDSTVLITGETGTGKELAARAIHRRSRRASRAFVAVNCAAIPRDLIASELFGHEKGAFTGALQRRLGRFELADGGTIFLDEVGELASDTQVALLRVLHGAFRQDLFCRLHVFPLEMPPLRERREDIVLLVEYFIDRYAAIRQDHPTGQQANTRSPEVVSVAWECPRIAKRDRAVGDPVRYRRIHRGRELVIH